MNTSPTNQDLYTQPAHTEVYDRSPKVVLGVSACNARGLANNH